MRLDKYLKVVRIIKRRTIANELCDASKVLVNGKVEKAGYIVKLSDTISIKYGDKNICHTVDSLPYEGKNYDK